MAELTGALPEKRMGSWPVTRAKRSAEKLDQKPAYLTGNPRYFIGVNATEVSIHLALLEA